MQWEKFLRKKGIIQISNFGWGYAKINITTHAIEGLSENDFILAAKIDQIINV
jgi:pterin-4a-carbinolamine dehydratase